MREQESIKKLLYYIKKINQEFPNDIIKIYLDIYKDELLEFWNAGAESKKNGKSFNTFYEETFKK